MPTLLSLVALAVVFVTTKLASGRLRGSSYISHEIYTRFCCALFCCGYIMGLYWIHLIHLATLSGSSCWQWANRRIARATVKQSCWKWVKSHDDIIKWKHSPPYRPFVWGIHRSAVNSPHKGQWSGALIFSLICSWINGRVNNGDAGDLRHHRPHYDVTVLNRPLATYKHSPGP